MSSRLRSTPLACLLLLWASLALTSLGCAVVDDAKDEAQARLDALGEELGAHDFSGTLPLQWTSEQHGSGPVRLVLVQDGLSAYGVAIFEGHPCLEVLRIEADVTLYGLEGELLLDDEVGLPFELKLLGSSGPQKPSGVVRGVKKLVCLADEGLQLAAK